ncbi:MAG TPA: peptidogalycan biosysnthesis protein [Streptosporangiaceae bacterium]|nr:peptidogalycan biosysnthesis protein [Streptosporangiaceae bacterium]
MTAEVLTGFRAGRWLRHKSASPFHDVGWLTAMVSRLPGAVHTVVDDDRGVAFVAAVVEDPDGYEAYNPQAILWRDPPVFELADPAGRAAELTGLGERPPALPALVLVAPGYDGDPAGAGADRAQDVAGCVADVLTWCERAGLAGLHLLFTSRPAVAAAITALGGVSYPLSTRSVLPVWWDDWPGYLDGLPAKRRREVRRERKLALTAMELVSAPPDQYADDVIDGRCALLRRYGQQADPGAERRRLTMLGDRFGDRLTVYGGLREGRLVAGCLCLAQGRTVQVLYSAVTEEGHRLPYAHFATTYYAVVERVSRQTCAQIDYGISHLSGKRSRGCSVRRLYGHALGVTAESGTALRTAAGLLSRYAQEV